MSINSADKTIMLLDELANSTSNSCSLLRLWPLKAPLKKVVIHSVASLLMKYIEDLEDRAEVRPWKDSVRVETRLFIELDHFGDETPANIDALLEEELAKIPEEELARKDAEYERKYQEELAEYQALLNRLKEYKAFLAAWQEEAGLCEGTEKTPANDALPSKNEPDIDCAGFDYTPTG